MAFFLLLLMFLIPFLLGRSALGIIYGRRADTEFGFADRILTGAMLAVGLAEAAHLAALALGRSFSDCVKLFAVLLGACLLISAAWQTFRNHGIRLVEEGGRQRRAGNALKGSGYSRKSALYLAYGVFGVLALGQLMYICLGEGVYRTGDMTVETVNSFLAENAIYRVNPMTGLPYEGGIPLRLRILCLPSLYGALCRLTGLTASQVVWVLVPVCTLCGSYLAYWSLSGSLFPDSPLGRGSFMAAVALLFWVGDYMYGVDGFGILHGGFRGTVIRASVLLPYTFGLCMRKKWAMVLLCILTEMCIMWTLYGMGACLLAGAGMLAAEELVKRFREKGGKERKECRSF